MVDSDITFDVIGVHLKSQIPPGNVDDCDDEIRESQAESIARYITDFGGEVDFSVVVGDFNAKFSAGEFGVLHNLDYETMIPTDCDRPSRRGCSYLTRQYAGVIDHIAVSADSPFPIWDSGPIYAVDDLDDYLRNQSDHALVWASFRTTLDR